MPATPSLFDVHCHVIETQDTLGTLSNLNTHHLALMSAKVEDWDQVNQVYQAQPNRTVPCFGVHPWYATEALLRHPDWLTKLRAQLLHVPESCVGEIGIDKVAKDKEGEKYDWEDQLQVFSQQWQLAVELQRPVSMHAVHVSGFLLDFFRDLTKLGETHWPPCVMLHSFNGSTDLRQQLLRMKGISSRIYFSFSITIQRKQEAKLGEWLRLTPPSQILLESDVDSCEKVDEAMNEVYAKVETLVGQGVADLCFHNAMTFYKRN